MDAKDVANRVAKGAKRYDQQKPDWWSKKNIEIESLHQGHPRADVVGQNRKNEADWNGQFDYSVLGLGSIQEAAAEGFYFTVDEDGFTDSKSDTVKENELLTEAWRQEILARRRS